MSLLSVKILSTLCIFILVYLVYSLYIFFFASPSHFHFSLPSCVRVSLCVPSIVDLCDCVCARLLAIAELCIRHDFNAGHVYHCEFTQCVFYFSHRAFVHVLVYIGIEHNICSKFSLSGYMHVSVATLYTFDFDVGLNSIPLLAMYFKYLWHII